MNTMGESNTIVSAYTLYRHLQQYCFHSSNILRLFSLTYKFSANEKDKVFFLFGVDGVKVFPRERERERDPSVTENKARSTVE